MKLHPKMSPQEWKDLLNILTAHGALLTDYPETDNDGLFVDFQYATIEYNGAFYYIQGGINCFEDFEVTRYFKVNPYEKRQDAYPHAVHNTEELLEYLEHSCNPERIKKTHNQRIFLTSGLYNLLPNGKTNLWRLEHELAGFREKEILHNLAHITTIRHTHDYHVLRFHSADGNYFDYETKSCRITG